MASTAEPVIALIPATKAERPALDNLMQLYIYDSSELRLLDVADDGRFPDYPLDAYWEDAGRHPLLLRVDGRLAGFALVSEGSRLTGAPGVFDMAEFFVMRRFRRKGVGLAAASAAFDRFKGPWEIRQHDESRRHRVLAAGHRSLHPRELSRRALERSDLDRPGPDVLELSGNSDPSPLPSPRSRGERANGCGEVVGAQGKSLPRRCAIVAVPVMRIALALLLAATVASVAMAAPRVRRVLGTVERVIHAQGPCRGGVAITHAEMQQWAAETQRSPLAKTTFTVFAGATGTSESR